MWWEYGEYDIYWSNWTKQWAPCPAGLTDIEKAIWIEIFEEGGWPTHHLYSVCKGKFPEQDIRAAMNSLWKRDILYHTPHKRKLKADTEGLPLFVDPQPPPPQKETPA